MSDVTSTAGLYKSTMNNIMNTFSDIGKLQTELSSNSAVSNFTELAELGQLQNIQNLQSKLTSVDSYLINNRMVLDRLQDMSQRISNMINIASSMKDNIALKRSASGSSLDLSTLAKSNLSTIRDNLNSQFEGRYLFAGAKTDTIPVGDIVNNTNYINEQPVQNYYNGDATIMSKQVSDTLTLNYGVTADNPIFQKLIASFHLSGVASLGQNDGQLAASIDMISSAINGLAEIQSAIGNNMKIVTNINTDYTDSKTYLNEVISHVMVTNIPEASLRLNTNMAVLQGAYAAFAKLSRLNLVDYLR